MLLTYIYQNRDYKVSIQWTADTGHSAVFRDIVRQISDRHQFDPGSFDEVASLLDELADKLYREIYIFTNEHHGVSSSSE